MEKGGYGKPPEKFTLLTMGSGGRKEMMLNPEQYNGIVIGGTSRETGTKTRQWFLDFASQLKVQLYALGYEPSPINMVADNPQFNKTLEEWCRQLTQLSEAPDRKEIDWLKSFLDFDILYGDDELAETLRQHVNTELHEKPGLMKMMAEDNADWHPPLGLFNQLIPMGFLNSEKGQSEKDKIDIKTNGLSILTDVLRIYALEAGIRNSNSIDRLVGLVRQGVLSAGFANSIGVAYESLSTMLLAHMLHQAQKGKRLDKLIKPKQLSAIDQASLRISMRTTRYAQEKLQSYFRQR
jgi:CBS domain-containing protein